MAIAGLPGSRQRIAELSIQLAMIGCRMGHGCIPATVATSAARSRTTISRVSSLLTPAPRAACATVRG